MKSSGPSRQENGSCGGFCANDEVDTGTGPLSASGFGVYIHIPFCVRRCGYCDFNTYTAQDLGQGATQASFAEVAAREIELASREHIAQAETVFFGGGTPTVLPPTDLIRLLEAVRQTWGLAPGVEVTVEANPDSVERSDLEILAVSGFTRISFGMQSAVSAVLARLDRTHRPDRVPMVVDWAGQAGLAVSLDLIYGTPGETLSDWQTSLSAALNCGVQHLSCYALTVEPHTPMGRLIGRGQLPPPDEDDLAAKYELADEVLTAAGLPWYEISNWAAPGQACRHNLNYWRGGQWWGIGPGAHSAISLKRFWNVKHPRRYAALVNQGQLPIEGLDQPDAAGLLMERIMTGIRLTEGLDLTKLPPSATTHAARLAADGLLDPAALSFARARLTRPGRLLADTVTQALAA